MWLKIMVYLSVGLFIVPLGVTQVTAPVTSVSTEDGRVALHLRVKFDPENTSRGGTNSIVAMGTAQKIK